MSQTLRCFLAFELPEAVRDLLKGLLAHLKTRPLDVRWVSPQNIHLTMVFLGNIPEDSLGSIKEAVGKTCRKYGPFEAGLTRVGFFGSKRSPRVLWVGMSGDIHHLANFRDALLKALGPFGIKKETRPFRPHLTLGRFRKGAVGDNLLDTVLDEYSHIEAGTWILKELVLFKSQLTPKGAIYTKLCSWPLEGQNKG